MVLLCSFRSLLSGRYSRWPRTLLLSLLLYLYLLDLVHVAGSPSSRSNFSTSPNFMCSIFMRKAMTWPWAWQPMQEALGSSIDDERLSWNGHSPVYLSPLVPSGTYGPITSWIGILDLSPSISLRSFTADRSCGVSSSVAGRDYAASSNDKNSSGVFRIRTKKSVTSPPSPISSGQETIRALRHSEKQKSPQRARGGLTSCERCILPVVADELLGAPLSQVVCETIPARLYPSPHRHVVPLI